MIQITWTIIYLIAISTLGFNLLTEELNAQTKIPTQDNVSIPIDDQARYLRGLENRTANQWGFTPENKEQTLERYSLSTSEPEVKITEQIVPEWRNTGDDPNYSVLVDVYEFSEETNNLELN